MQQILTLYLRGTNLQNSDIKFLYQYVRQIAGSEGHIFYYQSFTRIPKFIFDDLQGKISTDHFIYYRVYLSQLITIIIIISLLLLLELLTFFKLLLLLSFLSSSS